MTVVANDIAFNKDRYERFDGPAKETVIDFLTQAGFKNIEENLDEAARKFTKIWDVRGLHPKLGEWRIEAEIKQDWGLKWTDMPFKYHTMDIPYRKRDKAQEHATHHIIVGGDLQRLFIVKREVVLASPKSCKKCRNRGWKEEPFFNVQLPSTQSSFWFKNGVEWKAYKE